MKKTIILFLLIFSLVLSGCEIIVMLPGEDTPTATAGTASTGDGCLTVHYIDVGQADCALIDVGGEYVLIDGGNRSDGQLVVSYLQQQGVEELEAVICTHAHEDHVGGLPSVLAVFPTKAVYAPTKTYSSAVFDDFVYYVDQQGLEILIPEPGTRFSLYGDSTYGAEFTVMGPVKSYAETNDTSIVMQVQYHNNVFLFTGDMEVLAENDMLDYWGSWDNKVDVLKIGHHGSDTSSSYRFLYETEPTYGVISVGEGNTYGHPHEEPMTRFMHAGMTLFRTDEMGTILAASDGTEITFTWENQNANPTNAEFAAYDLYIGNSNSKVFHGPQCSGLPSEKNRIEFASFQEAMDAGYRPCSNCLG